MSASSSFDWPTLLDRLSEHYGRGSWRVPYLREHAESPFQVLIGTILSQRTRDEATSVASERLFRVYPDAPRLARARPREIIPLIRACGFYRVKARAIRDCARELLERFGGEVPTDLESLLTLPSVGRKTANCVLVFGFGLPGVPVDTHVHRLANRLGVVRTSSAEETELALRRVVPEAYWNPLNPILVQHGQNLCRPRRPRCDLCPVVELCATGRAGRSGRAPPRPEDRRPTRSGRPARARAGSSRRRPGKRL